MPPRPFTFIASLAASALTLSPAFAADPAPEEKTVLEGVVMNIFNGKCVSCHGPSKQKGKLRLDSYDEMIKAGESGKASIVPKDAAGSESLTRVLLPADHDDHMPPKDKPQPTADEIEMLKWWIEAGADKSVKIKDAGVPDALKDKVLALAAQKIDPPAGAQEAAPAKPAANARTEQVIAIEKEIGSPILPLAQTEPGLTFNVVNVADKFDDGMLEKLGPIAEQFVELNLARSKVTDAGLATLAGMKNLTRLRLENTAVTDAGVDHLLGLSKLEYLNLYGTKITDAGLAKLEKLPNLKSLYVWQTACTKPAAEALHGKLPKLIINMGWETVVGVPPPPPPAAAPAPAPDSAAKTPPDPESTVFASLIQPLLNEKCAGCHGAEKQKGKYRLDDYANLMKAGESGNPPIVAGKSGESENLKRILLPIDHDDHMPPEAKPQVTEKEAKLLAWWIDAGASAEVKVKDANIPEDLLK